MVVVACLLGCAALTSTLTSALIVVPPWFVPDGSPPPAGAAAAQVRVLQMNLCDSGLAGCYTGRSVAAAAALIRAATPDVVTLNEVCRDDVPVLAAALAVAGRTATTTSAFRSAMDRRTGSAMRCRNGQPYGIGLLTRRSPVTTAFAPTSGIYPVQDAGSPEERAWLCQDAVTFTACTTHLDNADAHVARAQCEFLLRAAVPAVLARGGPARVVLGGDLNLSVGGSPDVRSCVPAGHRRVDDGGVQNVVVTSDLAITAHQAIDMRRTTDHPGLLVTLTPVVPQAAVAAGTSTDRSTRCVDAQPCLLAAWRLSR